MTNESATIRVLVLCDDYYHPARTAREGLAALEADGFGFDFIEDAADWSAKRMAGYRVVLLTKSNDKTAAERVPWVDGAVEEAFREYVRAGNGLLVIHSGAAGYAERPVLRGLLGGMFASHPPQCAVTVEPQPGHPLAVGVEAFTVHDEHYIMDLDDTAADVFLTTSSEHGRQPAGWTRPEGAGRVGLLTPGHNLAVWQHPSYRHLIKSLLLYLCT